MFIKQYLPTIKELKENSNLKDKLCPICNEREKNKNWWSCKKCAKRRSAKSYNNWIIKHQEYFLKN